MQYKEFNPNKETDVRFETFEVINGDIYAQIIDKNILAKISSGITEVVNTYDDYRFKCCTCINNNIYFADNFGEAFVEYDIEHNKFKSYDMNAHIRSDNNIAAVEGYGDYVFVISQYKGILFIFDTKNNKLKKEDALENRITELYGKHAECIIRCWKIEEYLYLFINNKDAYRIFKYNMEKKILHELSENKAFYSMRSAYCFEGRLYILQDDFTLCIWDVKNNQTQIVEMSSLRQLIDSKELKHEYAFSTLAVSKKNIWLFPAGDNEDIYIYDFFGKKAWKYDEYPSDFSYLNKKGWSKYADIKEYEGTIYVAARLSNYYLVIDIETGQASWKTIGSCDFSEYYHDLIARNNENQQVIYEQNENMFSIFINYAQKPILASETDYKNGIRIWEALK